MAVVLAALQLMCATVVVPAARTKVYVVLAFSLEALYVLVFEPEYLATTLPFCFKVPATLPLYVTARVMEVFVVFVHFSLLPPVTVTFAQ